MRLRQVRDQLYSWIRQHYIMLGLFLIGLCGGLFTAGIGLLLGILLEPLVQQFLYEKAVTRYLIMADPHFTAEIRPGITAFCGLAVYCAFSEQKGDPEIIQKDIVQHALDLFYFSPSDGPQVELLCRLALEHQQQLNGDLLAESLLARLKDIAAATKTAQVLKELVIRYAPKELWRLESLLQILAPGMERGNENAPWQILGVSPEASVQEIKKTFRRLALQFHPDSLASLNEAQRKKAEESFIRIRQAYREVLSQRLDDKS